MIFFLFHSLGFCQFFTYASCLTFQSDLSAFEEIYPQHLQNPLFFYSVNGFHLGQIFLPTWMKYRQKKKNEQVVGALFTSSTMLSFLQWLSTQGQQHSLEQLLCCEGDVGWQSELLVFSPSNFSGPFLHSCRHFYTGWHANISLCFFQHHTRFVATLEVLLSVLAKPWQAKPSFNQEARPGGSF